MKATGMIRRVDELGRIVLPKEVRRTLNIPDGTPMEIYVGSDQVVLKKYVPEEGLLETLNVLEGQLELEMPDLDFNRVKDIRNHIKDIRAALSGENTSKGETKPMTELDLKLQELKNAFDDLKEENKRIKFSNSMLEKELQEYRQLEEQGVLLKLPVAEGTTVYMISNNTECCGECKFFEGGYYETEDECRKLDYRPNYPQYAGKPICEKQFLEVIEYTPNLD